MKSDILIGVIEHDRTIRMALARVLPLAIYSVESFASAKSFLNRDPHQGPCCLLMDDGVPGLSGFQLQQILTNAQRTEQVIFIAGHADVPTCARAFREGAIDYLAKPLKEAELLQAVQKGLARSGHLFLIRQEKLASQSLLEKLTPREREVLTFVIAGKINKEIASDLGTGEKTIKKHRGHLMRKMNMKSVAELVHFSLQLGLKPACPYGTKVPYTSTCGVRNFCW